MRLLRSAKARPTLTLATVFAVGVVAALAFKGSGPSWKDQAQAQATAYELPTIAAAPAQSAKRGRSRSNALDEQPQTDQQPAAADHPPVQHSPEAEAETWTEAEVVSALEECVQLLAPIAAHVDVSKPIRNGQCGTPAPVLLRRVAGVELTPPALVNCRIAAKLHEWVERVLQRAARQMLNADITRIVTASAYTCRQRIGASNERVSEHSFANALDVSALVTADGRTIDILSHWGRTARDQRAQAKVVGKPAGGDARPLRDIEATTAPEEPSQDSAFLRRIHREACGIFGTVLGPEANEAHRNHLHFDLAARRRSAFCE